jgi:hypothetical protein
MSARSVTAAAIVAMAGLALLAAGCGGSSRSPVAQLNSTTTSAQQNGAVAFAGCMRSHGVSNWPDPNSSGVFDKSKLTPQQLGASVPRDQASQASCQHLLPSGRSAPSAAQVQQVRAQALRFSACVRSHGVPSFPDPDSSGRIADPASFGVDQGSPKFRAANQACRTDRPPYIPSNAAYDDYVRTHGG